MEENKNQQIDAFLKKQLQEIPLESPSKNFTSNIMDVLQEKESSIATLYKPLISKKVWIFVAAAIVAVFFIPFQKTEDSLLNKVSLDFSFLEKINLSGIFDGISISSTSAYVAFFFTIMIFIQVVFLKNHFNKRIEASL